MRTARWAGREASALLSAIAAAAIGCSDGQTSPATVSAHAEEGSASAAASACVPTNAHGKHQMQGYDCRLCHACSGVLAFTATVTFPGGTSNADGKIWPAGEATRCSVGCHGPFGAPPLPVSWNAGPLECTACHTDVSTPTGEERSSHFAAGVGCQSCHDQSQHTRGHVLILNADGSSASSTCVGCHRGQGQTLAGATPPLLVGWDDAVRGDFHGPRAGTCRFDRLDAAGQRSIGEGGLPCPAGQPEIPNALRITSRWWYATPYSGPWEVTCDIETVDGAGNRIGPPLLRQPCPEGAVLDYSCNSPQPPDPQCHPQTLVTRGFGGTLLPPYARGEGPLPCAACHDSHASSNSFLLAATVNGVTIPPQSIDRAGVGAGALCNACHDGDRHEVCKTCHMEIWTTDGEYSWFEGAPVDPVPDGSPCFYCHGHEGLRFMRVASPQWPGDGHPFGISGHDKNTEAACSHCHSDWRPPPTEYVAPAFHGPPVVTGITATTATVSWRTNEAATSYVEYGVGTAGHVAGDDAFVWQHDVTLAGLTPGTPYVWRVRTSDMFRNVTHTAPQTFMTTAVGGVPFPDLAPVDVGVTAGTFTTDVPLAWYPVTSASGTPVQYEVQLASDPDFSYLVNGFMVGPGVPGISIGDSGWIDGRPATVGGRPALTCPATLTNIPQDVCADIIPNVYYWRVRARDEQGHVSDWSPTGTFGAFASDPLC